MTPERIHKLVIEEAAKSTARKRKVGAVIVLEDGRYFAGHNFNPSFDSEACEDADGNTLEVVIHAEEAAIHQMEDDGSQEDATIYVSHPPCDNCLDLIERANLTVVVVGEFLKFDKGKLQYGLIPPSATKALAEVLTYGAKKYKPNNWKKGSIDRYVDAAMRHFEAYRSGEVKDEESGLAHLDHLLTNIAFLIELEQEKEK